MTTKINVPNIIEEYFAKDTNQSSTEICEAIFKDYPEIGFTHGTLKKKIKIQLLGRLTRKNQTKQEITIESENKTSWDVEDGRYLWKTRHGDIKIPVDKIDHLFFQYSEHGMNLSGAEIINEHDLELWQWESIRTTLNLRKKSHIFSPYTVKNTDPKEYSRIVAEKMEELFEKRGKIVQRQYNIELNRKYKQVIDKDATRELVMIRTIDDLLEKWPAAKQVTIQKSFVNIKNSPDHVLVAITDLHLGAKVEGLQVTRDYSSSIAIEYLDRVAKAINEIGAKKVSLALLGDLIESFTGLNHKNSWKSMEWNVFGSRTVINAIEILEGFFSKIVNLEGVYGIGGNHDRSTSDNHEDTTSEIAGIIFYTLQRIYKGVLNVDYKYDVLNKEIDGISYIFTHAHLGLARNKNQAEDIVLKYGNNKLFNMILSGHVHERRINKDTSRFRWVTCPPIFSGNRYSQDEGYDTLPGFKVFRNWDKTGFPKVDDFPL